MHCIWSNELLIKMPDTGKEEKWLNLSDKIDRLAELKEQSNNVNLMVYQKERSVLEQKCNQTQCQVEDTSPDRLLLPASNQQTEIRIRLIQHV